MINTGQLVSLLRLTLVECRTVEFYYYNEVIEIPKEQRNKMVAGLNYNHNYVQSNFLKRSDVVFINLSQFTIDRIRPVNL